MKRFILTLAILLRVAGADAAEYWVAKTGNDANNCTAAQSASTPKLTIASALTCESAGDTIWIGDGTYAETITSSQVTAGTSDTTRTALRAINIGQAIIKPNSGTQVVLLNNRPWVHFTGLVLDGQLTTNNPLKIENNSHHILLEDITIRNSNAVGLLVQSSPDGVIRRSRLHNNGSLDTSLEHGMYLNTGSDRWLIEQNEFDHNSQMGIQIYLAPIGTVFRKNYLHDNCQKTGGGGNELFISNDDHVIEDNLIVIDNSTGKSCGNGITIDGQNPLNNTIRNNTIVCLSGLCQTALGSTQGYGINVRGNSSTPTNTTLINNLVIGFGQAVRDNGLNTVQTTNRTTGTAADHFTDANNGDFSLNSGSAAIDGGTDTGSAFCGSSRDQGAFEALAITAAAINGNTLDVTVCSRVPPIQPLGTWTPGCTGTGCGTPVTSGTPSITGGGLVRITVSGITGGACASGQTWTIGASGNNTNSVLIGNQFNQPLHTVSGFAVDSSACTGSGGSGFPAGAVAVYNFENNLNDSSGNANHAVGSANISYAASKNGQGVQFTNGVNSYVDTGLLSGHNPSTTNLVVAFGVRISASELGKRRFLAGVDIGTDSRFYIRRDSDNIWDLSTQAVSSPVNTEFPVVDGDTHVCVKFNPTTDTATLYINGVAGTIAGASVQSYTSYTFPSALRFGLPSASFSTTQSPPDIIDQAYIYTTDVSCADIYAAWNPAPATPSVVQEAHQWQGVFLLNSAPEDRGGVSAQRFINKGGAAALQVQLKNTSGASVVLQPRFRYNIDGGEFSNVVPDSPTADGVSYWGSSAPTGLNTGTSVGPIVAGLTHVDGITLVNSTAIPTITMADDSTYTLTGVFNINAAADKVVCFKIYDQSGETLSSYAPSAGACLTVTAPSGAGSF